MALPFGSNQLENTVLLNAAVSSTGTSSAELDLSEYEGDILLTVSARTGGTNTMTITPKDSETSGGTFAAIDSDALINQATGQPDTFDTVSTTVSNQTLVIRKNLCNRYLRVDLSGTSLTQNVAIVATAFRKYATN